MGEARGHRAVANERVFVHERPTSDSDVATLAQVLVPLDPLEWHAYSAEVLWADPLANGNFLLRNTPFFAFELAAEDVVFAEPTGRPLMFLFRDVRQRNGDSTYRLFVRGGTKGLAFMRYWAPLADLDCTFEETAGNLVTINVPPHAVLDDVNACLEEGESAGVWEFEEGYCAHPAAHSYMSWRPRPSR